jgi:hypothetical protein
LDLWFCFTFVDLGPDPEKVSGEILVPWPGIISGSGITALNILFIMMFLHVVTRMQIYILICYSSSCKDRRESDPKLLGTIISICGTSKYSFCVVDDDPNIGVVKGTGPRDGLELGWHAWVDIDLKKGRAAGF